MSWKKNVKFAPQSIDAISQLPDKPKAEQCWKMKIKVLSVIDQETQDGRPYCFLNSEDGQGNQFSIVLWDRQLKQQRFKSIVEAPKPVEVEWSIKVPPRGQKAFGVVD